MYCCESSFTLAFSSKISFGLKKHRVKSCLQKLQTDFHAEIPELFSIYERAAPTFRGTWTAEIVQMWNFSFVTAVLHFRYNASNSQENPAVSRFLCKLYRIQTPELNWTLTLFLELIVLYMLLSISFWKQLNTMVHHASQETLKTFFVPLTSKEFLQII